MSRTCATALALVNWKGVFYERYLLDRHVTALEGANGAGKTTVMIAAYVVLLPDLARLRFTNLGETAATGGDRGLYGRLGEPGRPSYAAMELELADGSRVVAGVQLVRKAEPVLEITPFLVSGVDLRGSLKELLLLSTPEHDEVPELSDVRASVARVGGKMQVFGTAKEYFAALFERGITPLRLATEEERTKLHDMLRTSMTGGISRALTSELRSFLLKEETGLADTLARMRKNLDACRRTRLEVVEASALEHDITDVHSAGLAMFRARVAASRASLAHARAANDVARGRVARAEADLAALAREIEAAEAERTDVLDRHDRARAALQAGTSLRARVVAFLALRERLAREEEELEAVTSRASAAGVRREGARGARDAAVAERERARGAYDRAARGLADFQAGLDEMHRRSHAQRLARARLDEARRLLGEPGLSASTVDAALVTVRAELARLDGERARAARDLSLEEVRRAERAAAAAALAEIAGEGAPDDASAYDVARRELSRLSELEHVSSRLSALRGELAAAQRRAASAAEVHERARALGLAVMDDGSAVLHAALASADVELRSAEQEVWDALAAARDADRAQAEAAAVAERLSAEAGRWEELAPVLARVEARAGGGVRSAEHVARLRATLGDERERLRDEVLAAERARAARVAEADALEEMGGVPADLLAARDALGAELLASRFEDVRADEAAWLEAALGPLARALVVEDPGLSAEALAQLADAPEAVWLVAEEDVPRVVEHARALLGAPETVDVAVRETLALRVSRPPALPILGRQARTRRAAKLRAEAERETERAARALESARTLDAAMRDADRLLGDAVVLAAGDPSAAIAAARQGADAARAAGADAQARAVAAETRAAAARSRLAAIQALAAEAHHLAPPDAAARAAELATAVDAAGAAAEELARVGEARRVLAERLDALRAESRTSSSSDAERARVEAERDRYFAAESALVDVIARKDALGWGDLDAAAGDGGAVRGALEAQHETARAAVDAADVATHEADLAWERVNGEWHALEAQRGAQAAACARLRDELAATGDDAVAAASIASLDEETASLAESCSLFGERERALATELARARERTEHVEQALRVARDELAAAEQALAPAEAEWSSFAERASAAGVLAGAEGGELRAPGEHLADARAQRALLLTRFAEVRGGAEGEAAVRAAFARGGPSSDAPSAYLEAWLEARAWAMRRLPAQFAEAAEPSAAIERLRADLALLGERVQKQESDLRGASEDVARGIDVHLRKTATRVRRLNRDLEKVTFGSVGAVRVHVKRVERMDLVLRALRGGDVQELLFQSDIPLDEALAEVFKRYGGGGRAGAAKVLDYREYIELVVEIQRRGKTEWEVASPTRLSTGEAIGVGAALMMVVLTEWERDANLLRTDRSTGTLRFLFLDEANRLSPDNLGVLFDLCRVLDLQLLVAAPEVARAHGNTTYRLVRHVDASGREEVLVSGRRAVPASPA